MSPPPNQNRLLVRPGIPEPVTSNIHKLSTEKLATAAQTNATTDDDMNDMSESIGPSSQSRLEQLMPSLSRHVHLFCEENNVSIDEWEAAVSFVRPTLYS